MQTKIALALALAASSGVGSTAGQDRPTFKSSVELVPISAVVRDGRNRLVTSLTVDDFQVLDNGARCRIVDFHRDQTSPLTVALLVDVSGSMRIGPKLLFAREVLNQMTVELADGSWFNVRPSNTEPLLRLNVEGADEASMAAVRDEVLSLIRST